MDAHFLAQRMMYLIPLVLSLTVHEFAHAWSAFRLGDDTAARMGRTQLAGVMIQMNIALALFNMLPIPPLDGSRVVEGLLPYRYRPHWDRLASLGPILLLVAVAAGGYLIAGPARFANHLINRLLISIAGGAA